MNRGLALCAVLSLLSEEPRKVFANSLPRFLLSMSSGDSLKPDQWIRRHEHEHCKRGERCAAEYQARISGPLLDRIDLQIEVAALPPDALANDADGEPSAVIAARVAAAAGGGS